MKTTLMCNFRYASLYFCCAVENEDNELLTLEIIHRYVELLDKYFGSVSYSFLLYSFFMGAQWLNGRVLTQDRGVAGSSLTGVTTLCP